MKNLLFVTLFLVGSFAHGSVWNCELNNGNGLYLVAVNPMGEALVFKKGGESESKEFASVRGSVSHVTAADGGPTTVVVTPAVQPVDWSKTKACYVMNEPRTHITLGGGRGVVKGELRFIPSISMRPKAKGCSIPRPLVVPLPMTCEVL